MINITTEDFKDLVYDDLDEALKELPEASKNEILFLLKNYWEVNGMACHYIKINLDDKIVKIDLKLK